MILLPKKWLEFKRNHLGLFKNLEIQQFRELSTIFNDDRNEQHFETFFI